jgi:hypothetical protein
MEIRRTCTTSERSQKKESQRQSKKQGLEKQCNKWKEHFEQLMNRETPGNSPDTPLADEYFQTDYNKPTRLEIKPIEHLKNGKAKGPDSRP